MSHLAALSEEQLKERLEALLAIVPSYQQPYFYNCALIDPYLLASYGLELSRKRPSTAESQPKGSVDTAVCMTAGCDLVVQFDTNEDLEEK
jgi:hypothetical protein